MNIASDRRQDGRHPFGAPPSLGEVQSEFALRACRDDCWQEFSPLDPWVAKVGKAVFDAFICEVLGETDEAFWVAAGRENRGGHVSRIVRLWAMRHPEKARQLQVTTHDAD